MLPLALRLRVHSSFFSSLSPRLCVLCALCGSTPPSSSSTLVSAPLCVSAVIVLSAVVALLRCPFDDERATVAVTLRWAFGAAVELARYAQEIPAGAHQRLERSADLRYRRLRHEYLAPALSRRAFPGGRSPRRQLPSRSLPPNRRIDPVRAGRHARRRADPRVDARHVRRRTGGAWTPLRHHRRYARRAACPRGGGD